MRFEDRMLTDNGPVARVELGSSQPADPESPDDTKTVMPSAAACCAIAESAFAVDEL